MPDKEQDTGSCGYTTDREKEGPEGYVIDTKEEPEGDTIGTQGPHSDTCVNISCTLDPSVQKASLRKRE